MKVTIQAGEGELFHKGAEFAEAIAGEIGNVLPDMARILRKAAADHRVWITEIPYPAIKHLAKESLAKYRKHMVKMVDEIMKTVREGAGIRKSKASDLSLYTPETVTRVSEIIEDTHLGLINSMIGPEGLTAEQRRRAKAAGGSGQDLHIIRDAFDLGRAIGAETEGADRWSFGRLESYARGAPDLTRMERLAVDTAQLRAAQFVRGLGNRIDGQLNNLLVEADSELRARLRGNIQDETSVALAKRETAEQLRTRLGSTTKDWSRDWARIAITEMGRAQNEAIVEGLMEDHGDDVSVAKRPSPDACAACLRLHLDSSGNPKIFRMSDLVGNGDNVGIKRNAWRAVVGPTHPGCHCKLIRIPKGWGYGKDGRLRPNGGSGAKKQ